MIEHLDRESMMAVGANVQGRSFGEVDADAKKLLKTIAFPPGYDVVSGGQSRDQAEVFGSIFGALGLAVMLMYLILVVQFHSFLAPVSIMMSLPLSLIGVVLSLLITGATLNLMSLIGVVMLMGIVVKNGILLIDCARKKESEGFLAKKYSALGVREGLSRSPKTSQKPSNVGYYNDEKTTAVDKGRLNLNFEIFPHCSEASQEFATHENQKLSLYSICPPPSKVNSSSTQGLLKKLHKFWKTCYRRPASKDGETNEVAYSSR